jgi:probable rRNA maturation factor
MPPSIRPAAGHRDRTPSQRVQVEVIDRQRAVRIAAAWLERVVRRALARQRIDQAEVCVLLVGDRAMATLHQRWLGLPGPTDVITFDLTDAATDGMLRGDIAVDTAEAVRAARAHGWPARCEVAYCVIHGLLHLAGFDDHTPADRRAMRARERVLLSAAGLPRPPRGRKARASR